MILYHVTHRPYSVLRSGLNPLYSQGNLPVIWLCDLQRLEWALPHVANHHGIKPRRMTVMAVDVQPKEVIQWRPGVYICKTLIPKERITIATIAS